MVGAAVRRGWIVGLCLAALPPDAAAAAEVAVTVAGVRGDRGTVAAALFGDAEGFLKAGRQAAGERVEATEGSVVLVFEGVPPGSYAVVAYHDENGNGELDTGLLGIPTEGVAFSNGQQPGSFGPPSFDAVKVDVGDGPTAAFTVEMRYRRDAGQAAAR